MQAQEEVKEVPQELLDYVYGILKRGHNGERLCLTISTSGDQAYVGLTNLHPVGGKRESLKR